MWNIVFTILVILAVAIGYGWYYFRKKEKERTQRELRLAAERQEGLDRWARVDRMLPRTPPVHAPPRILSRKRRAYPSSRVNICNICGEPMSEHDHEHPTCSSQVDTVTPFVTGVVVGVALDSMTHSNHSSSEDSGMRGGGGESDGGGASGSFDSGSSVGDSGGGGDSSE